MNPGKASLSKDLRESRRWLRLIQRVPLLKAAQAQPLVDETEELIRIFAASLRTAGKGAGNVERSTLNFERSKLKVGS